MDFLIKKGFFFHVKNVYLSKNPPRTIFGFPLNEMLRVEFISENNYIVYLKISDIHNTEYYRKHMSIIVYRNLYMNYRIPTLKEKINLL